MGRSPYFSAKMMTFCCQNVAFCNFEWVILRPSSNVTHLVTLQSFGPLKVGRNVSETNPQRVFSRCWLGRNHMFFTNTKNIRKSVKNWLFGAFLTYVSQNGPTSAQKLSSQYQPCISRIQIMYEEHFQSLETTLKLIFSWAEVTCMAEKMLKNGIFQKLTFWISARFGPKHIVSARSFWIRKKHKKCYLATCYNIWISPILFEINIVEICSRHVRGANSGGNNGPPPLSRFTNV